MTTSNGPSNRRHFLHRLALLAGGLTVAGLSGCGRAETQTPPPGPTKPIPGKGGKQPNKPPGS
jgi:hypothetical protein